MIMYKCGQKESNLKNINYNGILLQWIIPNKDKVPLSG